MESQFIGTNIRVVQDMIDYNFENKTSGVVLFLDFCKAFDSVSHTFLFTLLWKIKVPQYFIKWASLMYQDAFSCVKYNNWLMPLFPLRHGVKQGCLLSCHLFNLVGQVLVYSNTCILQVFMPGGSILLILVLFMWMMVLFFLKIKNICLQ